MTAPITTSQDNISAVNWLRIMEWNMPNLPRIKTLCASKKNGTITAPTWKAKDAIVIKKCFRHTRVKKGKSHLKTDFKAPLIP